MALVWSWSLMMENDVFHALEHTLLYYILESLQMWGKLLLTGTIHQKNEKGMCKICNGMTKMLQLGEYLTISLSARQIQTNTKLFTISIWY
jgi:hypothetical protein